MRIEPAITAKMASFSKAEKGGSFSISAHKNVPGAASLADADVTQKRAALANESSRNFVGRPVWAEHAAVVDGHADKRAGEPLQRSAKVGQVIQGLVEHRDTKRFGRLPCFRVGAQEVSARKSLLRRGNVLLREVQAGVFKLWQKLVERSCSAANIEHAPGTVLADKFSQDKEAGKVWPSGNRLRIPVNDGRVHFASIAALLLLATFCRAELIPAERLVPWTPGAYVGVPGGIPSTNGATIVPVDVDTTGVNDASSTIQTAVNAASSNTWIILPAGTLKFTGSVSLKTGVRIRGAGISNTFINFLPSSGSAFAVGANNWISGLLYPSLTVASGYTKGSTNIVLTDASGVSVGQMMELYQTNNPALPVLHTGGYDFVQRQFVRVVAKSGNDLTIWPPMYFDMTNVLGPRWMNGDVIQYSGVEKLSINSTNSTSTQGAVEINQAFACWVYEVKVNNPLNYGISIGLNVQCEVRRCWVNGPRASGSNRAGYLVATLSGLLFEDNIANDIYPGIEVNYGVGGSVFGYNFVRANYFNTGIDMNHGPHNHHNLYEGNIVGCIGSDGYFGSESEATLYRNWFHGMIENPDNSYYGDEPALWINRFARNFSVVGNIIGTPYTNFSTYGMLNIGKPNIGNVDTNGMFAPPWQQAILYPHPVTYTMWATDPGDANTATNVVFSAPAVGATNVGWSIQDRSDGSRAIISRVLTSTTAEAIPTGSYLVRSNHYFALAAGPEGFQEYDTNVLASMLFKTNYYYPATNNYGNLAPTNQQPNTALGADAFPSSLYRDSQPSFASRWPLMQPDGATKHATNDAGLRFYNMPGQAEGGEEGGGGVSSVLPVSLQGRFIINGMGRLQ